MNAMKNQEIQNFVNIPSIFTVDVEGKQYECDGIILRDEHEYCVEITADIQICREMFSFYRNKLSATINNIDLTIIAWNKALQNNRLIMSIKELIVGRNMINGGDVTTAEMDMPELSGFFLKNAFQVDIDDNDLGKYIPPKDININDELGSISIKHELKVSFSDNSVAYNNNIVVHCEFNKPVSYDAARCQIAKVRNLMTFLANRELPLRDIRLGDSLSKPSGFCNINYYLFGKFDESIESEPFYIIENEVTDNIQEIWDNWTELYRHKYITGLFYEVIVGRSVGINAFLNFSMALDLFEQVYRKKYIEKLHNENRSYIKSYYLDALIQTRDYININEDKTIYSLMKNLSKARNYFTHYNPKKEKDEPSAAEVFSMCRIVRLILLVLVYKKLGIPNVAIRNVRNRGMFNNIDTDVKISLKKKLPRIDYNETFA